MILILGIDTFECNAGLSLYTKNFLIEFPDPAICLNIVTSNVDSEKLERKFVNNKIMYNLNIKYFNILNTNYYRINEGIDKILELHPEIKILIFPDFIFYPYLKFKQLESKNINIFMFIHLLYRGFLYRYLEHNSFISRDSELTLKASWIEEKCMKEIKNVICNSEFTKRMLLKCYPEYKGNIKVIPLGVNKNVFKFSPQLKQNNVIFFSRLCPQKGIDYLIKDILKNKDFYKENPITICSGTSYSDIEMQIIKFSYFNGCINYLGPISHEELYNILKNFKFCVFPSIYEPYCLSLNEALSMGKVCIVNSIDSGMLDQITSETAIKFNFETESLADFLKNNQETDYTKLVEKASQNANDFDQHILVLKKYLEKN